MVKYKRSRRKPKRFTRKRRRSYKRMSMPKVKRSVVRNTKRIKKISDIVDNTTATKTIRGMLPVTWFTYYGEQQMNIVTHNQISSLRTAISKLEYLDPLDPAGLVVLNGNEGDVDRRFLFSKSSTKLTIHNTGFVPANFRIWKCFPKEDTDKDPLDAMVEGFPSQTSVPFQKGVPTNILIHPQDCVLLNDLWRLQEYEVIRLMPGSQIIRNHYSKSFEFNPQVLSKHSLNFQASLESMCWLVAMVGDSALPSDESTIFSTNAVADVQVMVEADAKITYDAGTAMDRLEYIAPSVDDGLFAYQPVRPAAEHIASNGDKQP